MTYSILRLLFFIKSSILLQTNLLKHIEGQFLILISSDTHVTFFYGLDSP